MIIINSHGICFEANIGMVNLKYIYNHNGKVPWGPCKYKVKKLIIHWKTYEDKRMFLSVTGRWGLCTWQAIFLLKLQKESK